MELRKKRIISALLALLLIAALPVRAQALDRIDREKEVTLTIQYQCGGKPAPGVEFKLYKVADVSASGTFTLTGDFKDCNVSLEVESADGWRKLTGTLESFVLFYKLEALDTGKTNSDGALTFPTGDKTLLPGLYLAVGGQYQSGRYTYLAEPSLAALPNSDSYDVEISPKNTRRDDSNPPSGTIERKVLKVWEDTGFESRRPDQVRVYLMDGEGTVRYTATLNADNKWSCLWTDLDPSVHWTVMEEPVPGYTVTSYLAGATFQVTNTVQKDDPGGPNRPGGPDDPGKPDAPNQPEDPSKPDDPDVLKDHNKPNGPNGPDEPSTPDGPDSPGSPDQPGLPQTGVLWWPVPVLAAAGLLLIVVGCVRRRECDAEQEDA